MEKNTYDPTIEGIHIKPKGMKILKRISETPNLCQTQIREEDKTLSRGSLFYCLQELQRQHLIIMTDEEGPFERKIPRKFLNLTEAGKLVLEVLDKIDNLIKNNESK